ncbi:O-methyltransferase [Azorhizobium sp. AG788]|uniref:O-methyltransferase n=1 Tax=Azorhizobium sp. AG788 TaxID=2183897 RepID=UPI003139E1B7
MFAQTLAASAAAGLPAISVSAAQGRMLELFARMQGARRILEIGTLGGYSTLWLARALAQDGRLVTLEADPHHAAVAADTFARSGLGAQIDLRVGRAIDTLPGVEADGIGPFDLIFIDADKTSNPDYLFWSLRLSRPGTLIICDNVVRGGKVIAADSTDPSVQGVRRFFDLVAAEPRLVATAIQTVGAKGYDGFAMALVVA